MTDKLFTDLGLSPEVLKAIDRLGFEKPAPIQANTIPPLLEGKDLVGQSQTGSGKTAAFAIPAIERTDAQVRAVQALILCPTRELAIQVAEEVHKLGMFKRGLHALPIFGGQSYDRQIMGLRQGAQIVIGTPGRVMDHMRRGTLRLDRLKMIVLDEADVMLDMGFREDIESVLAALPVERQTVFFSATMPKLILDLIKRYSKDPVSIRIEQKAMTVPTVEQVYFEVDRWFKTELLTRLLDFDDYKRGIIFCNTKLAVDELVDHLIAQGYSADRLHGDMTQAMRDRVMQKFRGGKLEFLVATDVAARGIDVDDVQVVFNYDIPYDVEDYVHRIGRTGRAGRSGRAVSFVSGREFFRVRNIGRFINARIERGRIPSLREIEDAKVNATLDQVRVIIQGGKAARFQPWVEQLIGAGHTPTDVAAALFALLRGDDPEPTAQRDERREFEPQGRGDREDRGPRAPQGRGGDFHEEPRRPFREERRDDRRDPGQGGRFPRAERRDPRDEVPRERAFPRREASTPAREIPTRPRAVAPPATDAGTAEAGALLKRAPLAATLKTSASVAAKAVTPMESSTVALSPVPTASAPEATGEPKAVRPVKEVGRYTKLWIGVGEEHGLTPEILKSAIMGTSGLPASEIGRIDIRERHVFVDVGSGESAGVLSKMKRAEILGKRVKAKVA